MGLPYRIITGSAQHSLNAAGYAAEALARTISQSITITRLARFADYCVLHATRRSESSGIRLSDLTRQQATSEILRHEEYWANVTGRNLPTSL